MGRAEPGPSPVPDLPIQSSTQPSKQPTDALGDSSVATKRSGKASGKTVKKGGKRVNKSNATVQEEHDMQASSSTTTPANVVGGDAIYNAPPFVPPSENIIAGHPSQFLQYPHGIHSASPLSHNTSGAPGLTHMSNFSTQAGPSSYPTPFLPTGIPYTYTTPYMHGLSPGPNGNFSTSPHPHAGGDHSSDAGTSFLPPQTFINHSSQPPLNGPPFQLQQPHLSSSVSNGPGSSPGAGPSTDVVGVNNHPNFNSTNGMSLVELAVGAANREQLLKRKQRQADEGQPSGSDVQGHHHQHHGHGQPPESGHGMNMNMDMMFPSDITAGNGGHTGQLEKALTAPGTGADVAGPGMSESVVVVGSGALRIASTSAVKTKPKKKAPMKTRNRGKAATASA